MPKAFQKRSLEYDIILAVDTYQITTSAKVCRSYLYSRAVRSSVATKCDKVMI